MLEGYELALQLTPLGFEHGETFAHGRGTLMRASVGHEGRTIGVIWRRLTESSAAEAGSCERNRIRISERSNK
jgi:hypothetical protein